MFLCVCASVNLFNGARNAINRRGQVFQISECQVPTILIHQCTIPTKDSVTICLQRSPKKLQYSLNCHLGYICYCFLFYLDNKLECILTVARTYQHRSLMSLKLWIADQNDFYVVYCLQCRFAIYSTFLPQQYMNCLQTLVFMKCFHPHSVQQVNFISG